MLGEAWQEIAKVLVWLLSQFWPQKARKDAEKFGFGFFCVLLRPSAFSVASFSCLSLGRSVFHVEKINNTES
jgi:hypothetical protein